jgi:hypothetical protein
MQSINLIDFSPIAWSIYKAAATKSVSQSIADAARATQFMTPCRKRTWFMDNRRNSLGGGIA